MADVASAPESGLALDQSYPSSSLCPSTSEVRPFSLFSFGVPTPLSPLLKASQCLAQGSINKALTQGQLPRLWDRGLSFLLSRGNRWENHHVGF